jgi:hypothetical protein
MSEIIFLFFMVSGVCAWGFIAYVLINLFMGDK